MYKLSNNDMLTDSYVLSDYNNYSRLSFGAATNPEKLTAT